MADGFERLNLPPKQYKKVLEKMRVLLDAAHKNYPTINLSTIADSKHESPVCSRIQDEYFEMKSQRQRFHSKTVRINLKESEIKELAQELEGFGHCKYRILQRFDSGADTKILVDGVQLGRLI